jgi:hypothetical protein
MSFQVLHLPKRLLLHKRFVIRTLTPCTQLMQCDIVGVSSKQERAGNSSCIELQSLRHNSLWLCDSGQNDREVYAAKAETSSVKAALNAQLQLLQNQLKEAQESYELKLMMTASDAMERENRTERQLKEAEKVIEELRRKLSHAEKLEAVDSHDEPTSHTPSIRQQSAVAVFSQKNLLLRSAPQPKRPRVDISQQNLRECPAPPISGESCVAHRSQTQSGHAASISGTSEICSPMGVDAFRDLVRLNSQSVQQHSVSPEMRFIQQCLLNGPISPFKQLLLALSESGSLGESEALMNGSELLSSL